MSKKAYCKLGGEHLADLVKGEEVVIDANGIEAHLILSDIGFFEIGRIVGTAIREYTEETNAQNISIEPPKIKKIYCEGVGDNNGFFELNTGDMDHPEISFLIQTDSNVFNEASFLIYANLIIMHSAGISAQWPLKGTGIQLTKQNKNIMKIAFMGSDGISYQSFYLNVSAYDDIKRFFKQLGFPMPEVEQT